MRRTLLGLSSFFALTLFTSTKVWAAGTIAFSSVTGASAYTSTGTATTIYGGLAGKTCSTADDNGTCDTCNATINSTCTNSAPPLCACNPARIDDNFTLRINVTKTAVTAGNAVATVTSASGTTKLNLITTSNNGDYVDFLWSTLCAAMETTPCSAVSTGKSTLTVTIFIDNNANGTADSGEPTLTVTITLLNPGDTNYNVYGSPTTEGIGGFSPYPGDEKVYIQSLVPGTFPSFAYGGIAQKMRVYIADTSLKDAAPGTASSFTPEDLNIVTDGQELERNIVNGLENGKRFFFRIALLDQAGNIVQFFPALTLTGDDETNCNTTPSSSCPYSATPDQVLGLLTKDVNCFIATAAFGSSFGPQLKAFRDFRYFILLRHDWGRWFVTKYYAYGPYAARYIADKPILRALVRGALWPFYGFSLLALRFGLGTAAAFALLLISISIGTLLFTFRKMQTLKTRQTRV